MNWFKKTCTGVGNWFKAYFTGLKENFRWKHYILYIIVALFTIIAGTISVTAGINLSTSQMFEQIGYSIIAVISLSLVVGFLGELSLGHAGFMSIGAYFGVMIQQTAFNSISQSAPLLSLILAMIVGGLVAALAGFIIGLPALRLKGDYLAIVTLAFGEIVKAIFQNSEFFGAAIGLSNNYRYSNKTLFIIIFVMVLLTIALVKNLLKSKHGRAVMAIRDNEIAARAMGVNVTYYKIFIFVISAFLAGIAGVLYGASHNQIMSTNFDYNYSINNILVMVVIGGMGNLNGSIIAAIVVTFLNIKLQTIFTGNLAAIKNIIYALILILIVIYNNAPSLKWVREKYNFKILLNKVMDKLFEIPWLKKFKPVASTAQSEQKDFNADWSVVPTKIKMDSLLTTDITIEGELNVPDKPRKEK